MDIDVTTADIVDVSNVKVMKTIFDGKLSFDADAEK